MPDIIRQQNSDEKKDFEDIWFKEEDKSKQSFYNELAKKEKEAMEKLEPFARKIAIEDFSDHFKNEKELSMKKHNGFVIKSEIKPFKPDWKKYGKDNFEILETGEISDTDLNKKNPGLDIKVAFKKYQYKDYSYTVTVMEDGQKSIERAQKKRRNLDKGE